MCLVIRLLVVLLALWGMPLPASAGEPPPQTALRGECKPVPPAGTAGLIEDGRRLLDVFDFGAAERCFAQALRQYHEQQDRPGELAADEQLGALYRDTGRYDRAVETYAHALALVRRESEPKKPSVLLLEIGKAHDEAGRFTSALASFRLVLADADADLGTRAEALVAEVGLYARLQRPLDGIELLHRQDLGAASPALRSRLATLEGDLLAQAGKAREALAAYDLADARPAAPEAGPPGEREPKLGSRRGLAHLSLGQLDDAERDFRQSGDPLGGAQVALRRHQPAQARRLLAQVRSDAEALDDPRQLFACQLVLASSWLEADPASLAAESALREAIGHLERYRKTLPAGRRVAFLADSTHGLPHLAAYRTLTELLALRGSSDEAFRWSEYTRARLLAETLEGMPNPHDQALLLLPDPPMQPFSKVRAPLSSSMVDMPTLFDMLDESVYGELGSRAPEETAAAAALLAAANFDPAKLETLRRKIELFRANGLKNHLTQVPPAGGPARPEDQ